MSESIEKSIKQSVESESLRSVDSFSGTYPKTILSICQELQDDINNLKKTIYGGDITQGIDTSLALIEFQLKELKRVEEELDERIYRAITQGFCKAISDWCQSHVIESISSVIIGVAIFVLMLLTK